NYRVPPAKPTAPPATPTPATPTIAARASIAHMRAQAGTEARAAILQRVQAIPPGYVRTYGDVSPGAPRLAGYVLSLTSAREAPWHRVVRADGSLAKGIRQRRLLEAEA